MQALNKSLPELTHPDGDRDVLRFVSSSPEETRLLGESLSHVAFPGMYVLLYGDLGTGKTEFVRGFARGAGWNEVRSPSFTIVNEYPSDPMIVHVDLYRVETGSSAEFDIDEYSSEGRVILIEWADRWKVPPFLEALVARFFSTEDQSIRIIEILCRGESACESLNSFSSRLQELKKGSGH